MIDTLTIAIAFAIFAVLAFIDVLRANRSMPLFGPRRGEGDQERASDVNAELDRSGLPFREVGQ